MQILRISNCSDQILIMPLESVEVDVKIIESLAQLSIIQTFHNPEDLEKDDSYFKDDLEARPIEVLYCFPKLERSVVKKLTIMIGDDRVGEA